MKTHEYKSRLTWDGAVGDEPFAYQSYNRKYTVHVDGKPDLHGSADPIFRGDPTRYNPEDLFVISLSSCHLLSYFALCARKGVAVVAYEDDASGTMTINPDGSGKFEDVTLRPVVTIAPDADKELALTLHDEAHRQCFIASSVAIPVHHEATICVASAHAGRAVGIKP
ncbi:MAG: OsmC family protein [Gemmatimonadaceae bacterium]